ncbi:HupE/UreJ family protein [Stigmatella sp. ncwal1]|uniref:HupE/UreJ family protein n=1 Tax=Stigmatella ashevillensis TaxID=2995309 RepID=A0ABT5D2B4_9BACT|nr:HupE/UreJ family protein [Stigmatella ashevillena]MDC0707214.1 HupE/UreJ family protein [Stigmatella ashevillena]
MRTERLAAPLALLLLLLAGGALAHDADLLFAQTGRSQPGAPQVHARLTMTVSTLEVLLSNRTDEEKPVSQKDLDARHPALAVGVWDRASLRTPEGPCARVGQTAQWHETFVELTATFHCPPGPVWQTFGLLSVLPPRYQVVWSRPGGGQGVSRVVDARQPQVVVSDAGEAPQRVPGLAGWVHLGMKHIFEGADHLAFLAALLLVGGTLKRVLALVSAFTVAHSLTLGATALGVLPLDAQRAHWAEVAIAVSILYVAAENLLVRQPRYRPLLTFLFGLVHGLGFARVLAGHGLEKSGLSELLGFNFGVELGQALVVLPVLPLMRLIQRRPAVHRKIVVLLSGAVLFMGINWLIERVG